MNKWQPVVEHSKLLLMLKSCLIEQRQGCIDDIMQKFEVQCCSNCIVLPAHGRKGCFSGCLAKTTLLTLSRRKLDLLDQVLHAIVTYLSTRKLVFFWPFLSPLSFRIKVWHWLKDINLWEQEAAWGLLGRLCSSVPEHSATRDAGQSPREASETAAKLFNCVSKKHWCPVRTGSEIQSWG